jgi:hypothetical protein
MVREREALGPQLPYLDTARVGAEKGSGVGLDDYEQQLANAYPWLHLRGFETADAMRAMKSAIDRHTGSAIAREANTLKARRCYDPAPIAYWAANPASRVVRFCKQDLLSESSHLVVPVRFIAFRGGLHTQQGMLKQGRVEYNIGSGKKPKWAKRMLCLNEAWAVCHEITAVSAADLNDGVVSSPSALSSVVIRHGQTSVGV